MLPELEQWDVDMTIRCTARLARVVRNTVAACGSIEGFAVDGIDDLRLLVDEAFMTLCETGVEAVRLRAAATGGAVRIDLRGIGVADGRDIDPGILRTLTSVIATEATIALDARPPHVRVTVRSE